MQLDDPLLLKVPRGQIKQKGEPATLNSPAGHVVHVADDDALMILLAVPAPHEIQFEMLVPPEDGL